MSTTSVIVEHLLAGLLALATVVLLALSFLGVAWIDLAFVKDWSVPLGTLALALAYPLGIAVDEASDALGEWRSRSMRGGKNGEGRTTLFEMLADADGEFLASYFAYTRGRLRMLRSAALILPCLSFAGSLFVGMTVAHGRIGLITAILVAGSAGMLLCLWAARRVSTSFVERREQLRAMKLSRPGDPQAKRHDEFFEHPQ